MDHRFIMRYEEELRHVREAASEFAAANPGLAEDLGLNIDPGINCQDPFVERLLEGFAFLTARVHRRMDSEYAEFTQAMLETVYPDYLAPLPSTAIVRFRPDFSADISPDGFLVPRHFKLSSAPPENAKTRCVFRTAHDVTIYPFDIAEVHYHVNDVGTLHLPRAFRDAAAAFRIRLKTGFEGLGFSEIDCRHLPFYVTGDDARPMRIFEHLMTDQMGFVLRPDSTKQTDEAIHVGDSIRHVGFEENEALLPSSPRSFEGYRILREHFALPQRNLFFSPDPLTKDRFRSMTSDVVDLIIPVRRAQPELRLRPDDFALYCTPVINLFRPSSLDLIDLKPGLPEHRVRVDRNRPLDFEVFAVEDVVGYGEGAKEQRFHPFYVSRGSRERMPGFYTVKRVPHRARGGENGGQDPAGYIGSEVYLGLVDADCAPYDPHLKQLKVEALCTNRHLPIRMPKGRQDSTDFPVLEGQAPVKSAKCLIGPTKPQPSFADGDFAWRLISHLSLNYLSLIEDETNPGEGRKQGARALRELLRLYATTDAKRRMVDAVSSVHAQTAIKRYPDVGPPTFVRGRRITIELEEEGLGTLGAFLFGSVLEQFFRRYVSINSFTETVLRTEQREEVYTWPARIGKVQLL